MELSKSDSLKVTLQKKAMENVKIDFNGGRAFIQMRLYLVENKMYLLQTITEAEKDNNKSVGRFMDSFALIK